MVLYVVAALSYVGIGRFVARKLRLDVRGAELFAYSVALGTGCCSLWLLGLVTTGAWAATRSIGIPTMTWVLVPGILAIGAEWLARERTARRFEDVGSSGMSSCAPTVALGILLCLASLGPETGFDSLAYHLPAAERIARQGVGPMVGCLDGEYRLGFDILWSPMIELPGGPIQGPALLHAMCAMALALAVHAEVRRRAGAAAAGITSFLLLASPCYAANAVIAYVDLAWGLYGFLAVACAGRSLREATGANLVAAGMLGGFALNGKQLGGAWIAATAFAMLVGSGWRPGLGRAMRSCLVAGLVAAPWFLRAWIDTGNPFFPMLLRQLGSGWADLGIVEATKRSIFEQTDLQRGPWMGFAGVLRVVFDPRGGFAGPVWILAFAPAAIQRLGTRESRGVVAGGLAAFACWAWSIPEVRFGFGAWAWAAVAAGVGGSRLASSGTVGNRFVVTATICLLGLSLWELRWVPRSLPAAVSAEAQARSMSKIGWGIRETQWIRELPRPIGVTGLEVALAGSGAISLAPPRNGILRDEDLDDPEVVLHGCRRLGLRSLWLRIGKGESPSIASRIAKCAESWAAAGIARIRTEVGLDEYKIVQFEEPR